MDRGGETVIRGCLGAPFDPRFFRPGIAARSCSGCRILPVLAITPRARASVKSVTHDTHDNLPLAKVKAGLEEAGSPLVELRFGRTGEATGVRSTSGSAEEAA